MYSFILWFSILHNLEWIYSEIITSSGLTNDGCLINLSTVFEFVDERDFRSLLVS